MVALLTPALSATPSMVMRRGPSVVRRAAAAFKILARDASLRGLPEDFVGIAVRAMALKLAEVPSKRYGQYRMAGRVKEGSYACCDSRHWKDGWRDGAASQRGRPPADVVEPDPRAGGVARSGQGSGHAGRSRAELRDRDLDAYRCRRGARGISRKKRRCIGGPKPSLRGDEHFWPGHRDRSRACDRALRSTVHRSARDGQW